MRIDGILNINKPSDITSFGVVSLVKRLSGQRKVGHAGTLDPQATGVLLVLMGQATRVAEYLLEAPKTYQAVIELGVTTDSYDATGTIVAKKDPANVTRKAIEEALVSFKGRVYQEPPMFSALRYQGERLYELARKGMVVPRKARERMVYRLDLVDWKPPLVTVELECQKGFYVRSLAHDLGESLVCGAYLKTLCRLKYGDFTLHSALSLGQVEEVFKSGKWLSVVYPIDSVLLAKKAIILGEENKVSLLRGKALVLTRKGELPGRGGDEPVATAVFGGELCRVYSGMGEFLSVGRWEVKSGILYPKKVFSIPVPTKF